MKIYTFPEKVLAVRSEEVKKINEGVKNLANSMADTLYVHEERGVGLAAPQVGVNMRLIVVDVNWVKTDVREPIFMVNPVIIAHSDAKIAEFEGCLSVPGIRIRIERYETVFVEYLDLDGKKCYLEADGLLSRCIQHEIDHLDGKTMIDLLPPLKRIKAISTYSGAQKLMQLPGDHNAINIE